MSTNLLRIGKVGLMSLTIWLTFTASTFAIDWSGDKAYTANTTISDNITLTGNTTINVASGATVTISGVISGTAQLTKRGAGALILTGNNEYTGFTFINEGTLGIGNGGASGSVAGNINVNGNLLVFNHSGSHTYPGILSGSGEIEILGTTFILSGNNTFTGRYTLFGDVLQVGYGISGSLGTSADTKVDLSYGGTLQFRPYSYQTFNGEIYGTGNIELDALAASTRLTLNYDNNDFTGETKILKGVLALSANGKMEESSGVTLMSNDAKLNVSAGNKKIKALNSAYADSEVILSSSELTIEGGGSFDGQISGTGGKIVKNGDNTLTFTGDNTYTGATTINAGTLSIGDHTTTGSIAGDITVNLGAYLRFYRSDDYTYSGEISGTGRVVKWSQKTLYLTGNNPFTGTTIISVNSGTLSIGDGGETGSIAGDINVNEESTLRFNRSNDYTYTNVITGKGDVYEEGAGTLTLTGNHTATGTFYCNKGGLVLAGNWAGNFVKNSGSTLTVTGNRTINGTLTMNGGITNMNLGAATPSRLSVTGALMTSEANTLNITAIGSASSYTLISAASGVSTTNFTVTGATGTLSATSSVLLTFTPGPAFVPVTDIVDVPVIATATLPLTLAGTVVPNDATNQAITWTVLNAGTTGAKISGGNILNTTGAGTAIVKATIVTGASPIDDFVNEFIITVSKAPQTAPAAPTLESSTYTSITLNPVTGCEYRRYDGAWQSSNAFTGLTHGTSYGFVQRYTETDTHLASPESAVAEFTTEINLGISEITATQIKIYPNPTSGELRITNYELPIENVEIYDIAGKKLSTFNFQLSTNSIDISHFSNGIYFLKINNKTVKVIKQ